MSKAFDCLSHELLVAKLDEYGFDKISLKLIHNYLSNRKQRVKINDKHNSYIFMCNMFYFLEDFDIANYVDDSTPYCAGKSVKLVVNNLEKSSTILFE